VSLAADPRSRPIRELPDDAESTCSASIEMDASELDDRIGDPDLQIIDVREAWERASDAIEPSLHIPLARLEQLGAADALHGLHPEAPTVVYCAHGIRSLRAAAILRDEGFRDVKSLRGGIVAWRSRR
jgi:adenylyltransferase/sulfurtransferase